MFKSSSGYFFDSVESFNLLPTENKNMIYWCDLLGSNKFLNDPKLIDKVEDDELFIELYKIADYYVEVILLNSSPESDKEIIAVHALKNVNDFRKKYNKNYWNKNFILNSDAIRNLKNDSFYSRHTVYADLPYKKLLQIVSDILVSWHLWETNEYDRLILTPLINIWNAPDINTAIVYDASTECHIAGSGISIKITNTHFFVAEKTDLEQPIPVEVINRTSDLPHLLQIGFSNTSFYSTRGFKMSLDFAKQIQDTGGRAYIFTSDDKLLAIQNDSSLSDEERIEQIHSFARNFDSNENILAAQSKTRELFFTIWNFLEDETKQFLITGVFLYDTFQNAQPFILDTAPASIEFSKSFEREIISKLLIPFKSYFNSLEKTDEEIKKDLKNSDISKITSYLVIENKKPPELGTLAFFLNVIVQNKTLTQKSITIKSFLTFVSSLKDSDFILNPNKLQRYLKLITTKYRNGAAHTEPLLFNVLNEFYVLLSSTPEKGIGILSSLINACSKKI